jgi:hypothetical protein
MNCKTKNLQMFVDWLHAAQEYMFQNVVAVRVNISGGRQLDTFAMGFLTFVPTHILGLPAGPYPPERNVSDYFQGNLLNTEGEGHSQIIIELADPTIQIYLLNVRNKQVETIKMKAAPCEISGNTLTIQTEGDDGLSYEIILSARKALTVPHQIIAC